MRLFRDLGTKRLTIRDVREVWSQATGRRPPTRATVSRWVSSGCRGVKLRAEMLGGRWYSRGDWLLAFFEGLTNAAGGEFVEDAD